MSAKPRSRSASRLRSARAELVGRGLAHGREAPVVRRAPRRGRRRGASGCCRRRRRESTGRGHYRGLARSPCRRALRDPRLPSVRRRRARAAAQGRPVPARRADPVAAQAAAGAALRRDRPCPASASTDGAACRARARSCARSRSARPAAAAARRRGAARLVERAEEWGDQVLQPLVRRVDLGRRCGARPSAMESYTDGRGGCPSRAPVARLSAPLVARLAQAANGPTTRRARRPARPAGAPRPRRRLDRGRHAGRRGGRNAADLQVGAASRCSPPSRTSRPPSRTGPRSPSRGAGSRATRGSVPAGTLPAEWLE